MMHFNPSRNSRLLATAIVVILVVGGAAVAAAQLPSVTTAHDGVIDACVHRTNGAARIVSGPGDCQNTERHARWSIQGPEGPQGRQGPQGPPGLQGETGNQGPKGDPGLADRTVHSATLQLPARARTPESLTVPCPEGKTAISGGYETDDRNVVVLASTPFRAGAGWRVSALTRGADRAQLHVNAVCALALPAGIDS